MHTAGNVVPYLLRDLLPGNPQLERIELSFAGCGDDQVVRKLDIAYSSP